MVVGEDKHRRYITFPKDLETKLEELAIADNRSFNNYILTILKRHVKETTTQRSEQ